MIQSGGNSTVGALANLGASRVEAARLPARTSDQESFAATLSRIGSKLTPRAAAEELVSVSLVQPVLEQLRAQNRAAPPFAPTEGERTFGALLDAEFAKRIVRARDFGLVDAVEKVMRKATGMNPEMTHEERGQAVGA